VGVQPYVVGCEILSENGRKDFAFLLGGRGFTGENFFLQLKTYAGIRFGQLTADILTLSQLEEFETGINRKKYIADINLSSKR